MFNWPVTIALGIPAPKQRTPNDIETTVAYRMAIRDGLILAQTETTKKCKINLLLLAASIAVTGLLFACLL